MSAIESLYTVTLTAAEIDELRWALDRSGDHDSIRTALDNAKPVKRRGKATAPIVDEPLIVTGDARLDEFMLTHHRADWREHLASALKPRRVGMMNMPTPPPGHPKKTMTPQERADLYRVHVIRSAGV